VRHNKNYSIRLTVPSHIGQELHSLALRESRSDSSMLNILVTESLSARRAAAAQAQKVTELTRVLRAEQPDAQ
jgi:hypothetical protein